MSKQAKPSRLKTNQAIAKLKMVRTSPSKINLVAGLIRNMKASEALVQLSFSPKRIAKAVKQCLLSAIANAENNNNLNIDNLYITEVMVGKSLMMKRFMPRARGRAGKIMKLFSNLSITVTEIQEF